MTIQKIAAKHSGYRDSKRNEILTELQDIRLIQHPIGCYRPMGFALHFYKRDLAALCSLTNRQKAKQNVH